MNGLELTRLRKAAVLAHAVSSLGAVVHQDHMYGAIVTFHPIGEPLGVPVLHPCDFRRVVADLAVGSDGDSTGRARLGLRARGEVEVSYFEMTDCRVPSSGLVHCVVDGTVVLCFASVLGAAEVAAIGELVLAEGPPDVGLPMEVVADDDVGATLAYHLVGVRSDEQAAIGFMDEVLLRTLVAEAGESEVEASAAGALFWRR